jgi:hypothetical protein
MAKQTGVFAAKAKVAVNYTHQIVCSVLRDNASPAV